MCISIHRRRAHLYKKQEETQGKHTDHIGNTKIKSWMSILASVSSRSTRWTSSAMFWLPKESKRIPQKVEIVPNIEPLTKLNEIWSYFKTGSLKRVFINWRRSWPRHHFFWVVPRLEISYVVYFDASRNGLGCVIMQNGRVIAYVPSRLHKLNYHPHDLEFSYYGSRLKDLVTPLWSSM